MKQRLITPLLTKMANSDFTMKYVLDFQKEIHWKQSAARDAQLSRSHNRGHSFPIQKYIFGGQGRRCCYPVQNNFFSGDRDVESDWDDKEDRQTDFSWEILLWM